MFKKVFLYAAFLFHVGYAPLKLTASLALENQWLEDEILFGGPANDSNGKGPTVSFGESRFQPTNVSPPIQPLKFRTFEESVRRAWRLLDENRKGHIDMEDLSPRCFPLLELVFSLAKQFRLNTFFRGKNQRVEVGSQEGYER